MLKEENKYLKSIAESLEGEEITVHMNNNRLLKRISESINGVVSGDELTTVSVNVLYEDTTSETVNLLKWADDGD